MPYFVKLPRRPAVTDATATDEHYLNIINGDGTLVQRELRRHGYAGYEPRTAATLCALFETAHAAASASKRFTFFDVGANGGLYSFLCKALYRDQVEVAAFEPAPDTHKWLVSISQANALEIRAEQCAVSDNEQDVVLYLSGKSDASNSLNANFKGVHKGEITVPCTTLDAYVSRTKLLPDVVKIDTETHEAHVLRGARDLLSSRHPFLVVEAIRKGGVDYGRAISEVLSSVGGYHYYRITESGFEPHGALFSEEKTEYRDWLVSPIKLDVQFVHSVSQWQRALARCGADETIS